MIRIFHIHIQIGPTWLNPTEDEVWPLEETTQVASLAFQGLETYTEGNSSDHGELVFIVSACRASVRSIIAAHTKTRMLLSCINSRDSDNSSTTVHFQHIALQVKIPTVGRVRYDIT